ncbi:pyruvate dehydrogenase (acetyl-transferring) E1 component subunit alpha [Microbulbifer thermotolerans]|uniref:pyruvate dehydrogenase (acetyl-transferring) E1 component subunit alpha n=1 Tax=Microbulbifer thermotolerans TaxID=252514 RepID=UPI00224ADC4D|nr:pyruvate dehydrogenase (acetyl-transferring) E1 component subunit alpha [Microbulbifer thermotolerans]MCX2778551.1 pyruvate dehydrogenase (acetyl-transferring) E1 component subunit alpha [Microbulbifer thermotolerans]MCX2803940.1 pyruvate dehydrogenase (acetyl-transferring) E1 component subunit alpha [Microbulbifer thermotolerans]
MHKPRMHLLASFDIARLQYLDEQGRATQELPDFATPDTLLALYRQMVLARLVDDRAVKLQRTGQLGTYPSSLGQEAIGVGTGGALAKDDVYCPYYRETGALLERGVEIKEILAIWGGDERGQNFRHAPCDLPLAIPIATQFLHAAGVAFALKYQQKQLHKPPRVAVASGGDGATSRGDFFEAINLAGVWRLPLVVVINNNQWAISVPRSAQTAAKTIAQKAIAAGIPGLQVDGNDVIAVRAAVADAVARARSGEGPTLIEATCYRLCDHTTADDAGRYQPREEVEAAWRREPVARLGKYLRSEGLWSDEQEEELRRELAEVMERALRAFADTPRDKPTAIFDHLYAELPEAFLEQYEQLGRLAEGRD